MGKIKYPPSGIIKNTIYYMYKLLLLAFWVVATSLSGIAQGWLLPAIRRTPPDGPEARRQGWALHGLLLASWACPLALAPGSWPAALAARAVLFDPLLSLAAGDPLFGVGQTALSDRALRWAAARLNVRPERLRGGLSALAAAAAGWYFLRI